MRVIVDYDLCESNGICMSQAPEVFELRDDDNLYVLQEHPAAALLPSVRLAVETCPKQAIKLVDE
jgi:ferredoxin